MKRLPKKFFIVSPDYVEWHKYSIKLGGITTSPIFGRCWFINETIALYRYRKTAQKAGLVLAQAQKCGFIEDVKRGEIFTKQHRASMILYDR